MRLIKELRRELKIRGDGRQRIVYVDLVECVVCKRHYEKVRYGAKAQSCGCVPQEVQVRLNKPEKVRVKGHVNMNWIVDERRKPKVKQAVEAPEFEFLPLGRQEIV